MAEAQITDYCLTHTLVEIIGYIFRAINAKQTPHWGRTPYIIQTILILLAPALFAASIYMEFGRVIAVVGGESHALVKRRFLTMFFVLGDVLSFLVQAIGKKAPSKTRTTSLVHCMQLTTDALAKGGAIMAQKSASKLKTGQDVILVGIFFQIAWFGFFVVGAVIFDTRIRKRPTQLSAMASIPWRKHLTALYAASGLILVRSIYRVAAYIEGNEGYLLTNEWSLYVFDAVLMLLVMAMFNGVHPVEIEDIRKGKSGPAEGARELR